VPRWLDPARIRAANARDVLERIERGCGDDRTFEQRSADASRARASVLAAQRVKWRFTFSPRALRPGGCAKPKAERSAEQKDYMRNYMKTYMRERRAKQKADAGLVRAG
jgi:hypothetical protein